MKGKIKYNPTHLEIKRLSQLVLPQMQKCSQDEIWELKHFSSRAQLSGHTLVFGGFCPKPGKSHQSPAWIQTTAGTQQAAIAGRQAGRLLPPRLSFSPQSRSPRHERWGGGERRS